MLASSRFYPNTLPALLSRRAAQTPTDLAYQFPEHNQAATWAELWQQVQTLAGGLARHGIGPGQRVALLLEGRLELVAALLAIVSVGAVAVPLNTYSKLPELERYLRDARPVALLLGTTGLRVAPAELAAAGAVPPLVFVQGPAPALPAGYHRFAELADPAHRPSEAALLALCTATAATAPALLLYTSGTTGVPRGVLRSTASFLGPDSGPPGRGAAALTWLGDRLTTRFGLLNLLPLYHQGGLGTLFSVLKLCNVPTTMLSHFNPVTALAVAEQGQCRFWVGTPYMVQAMLQVQPGRPLRLARLLGIAFASAAVTAPLLEKVRQRLPELYFFTVSYGSSEAGAVANGTCFFGENASLPAAAFLQLLRRAGLLSGEIPYELIRQSPHSVCGKLDKGVEVRLLDLRTGQPLPPGQPGEVAIRSHRVMRYTRDDGDGEQPAFSADGWYRSGDVGYLDAAGRLILTERLKRFISRGGEKISPTEVENQLRQHAAVADAYVLGVPDELYGEQVCAAVVPRAGVPFEAVALRAALAGQLSHFKVPRYLVALPELPLSGTGKVAAAEVRRLVLQQIEEGRYA